MLDNLPIAELSVRALLSIAVLMLLTGRLVPRSTYMDKTAEADRWQSAYLTEREARILSDAQTVELLELAKTTHSFIVGVFNNSEHIRRSGEPDAPKE